MKIKILINRLNSWLNNKIKIIETYIKILIIINRIWLEAKVSTIK
jgi:hypothetical protein